MKTTTTVVIGAGHAGLAMSRCLTDRSIDHVVLERGDVASSWRSRWDSLRLLTPNWQSRLPGQRYAGDDPDGFMTMPEVISFLDRYASAIDAPVETHTAVTSVRAGDRGYTVATSEGPWRCRSVVLANGACGVPDLPATADAMPAMVRSIAAADYRNPDELEHGGVLVVGAAATGVQLADEIQRSGRPVTLAVGGHVRAPRTYRGMDIMWWLDACGVLDERHDEVDDVTRVRGLPSFQLVGTPARTTLDLNALQDNGVRIVGKLAAMRDGTALFSGSLRNLCKSADLKLGRLLDTIDEWATAHGLDGEVEDPHRLAPTRVDEDPPLTLAMTSGDIKTVIWATGFRPDFSWLDVPVLDTKGRLHHDGGITPAPGLYAMGMPFLRRRKSTLIDGAADDARALASHLGRHLDCTGTARRLQAPSRTLRP
jgi:putative flavoprotein involved in K+ transport